jgi:DmsE family decaheme c-type cytochrome
VDCEVFVLPRFVKQHTLVFTLALSLPFLLAFSKDKQNEKSGDKPATEKQDTSPSHAKADPMKYVGTETCKTCHEDIHKTFEAGPHWKNDKTKKLTADIGQGCESCHGPGKDHVESGGDISKILSFKSMPPSKASETCLDCHQNSQDHINFQRSIHNDNKVGCTDCHAVHKPAVKEALLKAPQPQLCYGCHAEVKADFMKPFRHRVQEKLIACNDCHNPHGGFLSKQARATPSQDAGCFRCHSEKAGPFVFEHAPVKTEGCVACHTPHGSTNPRLLKRSNVNLLCLECHTFTVDSAAPAIPSFHNQAQKYQACTMCHASIHGSNFSNVFFK